MTKKVIVDKQLHLQLQDNPAAMAVVNEMETFFKDFDLRRKALEENGRLEFQEIWNRLGSVVGIDGLGTEEGPEARIEEQYRETLGLTILAVRPREQNPLQQMFSVLNGRRHQEDDESKKPVGPTVN